MKVVVLGAGYVGGAVAELLGARGNEVWAVRRSVPEGSALDGPRVRGVVADVTTGAGFDELPEEADVVVYAVSPGERSEEAYQRAYPRGVARALEAFVRARFLLVSSTSVYGEAGGGWVDDDTPATPGAGPARAIVEAERLVLAKSPSGAVVRASGIYGPGRTGLLERVRQGRTLMPTEPLFTNRIHRDDLARVLVFLAERPELQGTFLASDLEPVEFGVLQSWLADALGVPRPPRSPEAALSERRRGSKRCRPRRLLAAGYEFLYPTYREGYRDLVATVRAGRDEPSKA